VNNGAKYIIPILHLQRIVSRDFQTVILAYARRFPQLTFPTAPDSPHLPKADDADDCVRMPNLAPSDG